MKAFSAYLKSTGVFTSEMVTGCVPKETDTIAWMAGHHNHEAARVNLETGQVEDWIAPAPSEDHNWNETRRRWELSPEYRLRRSKDMAARHQIAELESKQHRPMRELRHADPKVANAAAQKLDQLDAQIAALRADLITERKIT